MEEKKKVSDAQKRAAKKYTKANYDEIKVRVPKGKKEIIQQYASRIGESTTAFINHAIDERMERDNTSPGIVDTVSNTMDIAPEQKPETPPDRKRRYDPFTKEAADSINLEELLYDDGCYRSQIAYKFGIDVLNQLLEKARQQEDERTDT